MQARAGLSGTRLLPGAQDPVDAMTLVVYALLVFGILMILAGLDAALGLWESLERRAARRRNR